jgi:pimeloyl-ACP methyl ester carboxylesterase
MRIPYDSRPNIRLADLYGRGYSDNPVGHAHSEHLYISQILAVLASSALPWTSKDGFHIIGYSLGGGISASFTRYFPELVTSLVLITPSGLVRKKHIAWQSYVLYKTGGILPESLVRYLVRRRLHDPKAHAQNGDFRPEDAMVAELGIHGKDNDINVKIDSAVQWQLDNHAGHLDAFISSIRYAPITGQHEAYRTIGRNISNSRQKPINGKVVLILGKTDPIVLVDEVGPDVRETIGAHQVHTVVLDAGHDVAISQPAVIVEELWQFWTAN